VGGLGYPLSSITLSFFILAEFCDSLLLYIILDKDKVIVEVRSVESDPSWVDGVYRDPN